jgi:hypothetical protein
MKDNDENLDVEKHIETMCELVNSVANFSIHCIKNSSDKKIIENSASLISIAASVAEIELNIINLVKRRDSLSEEMNRIRQFLSDQEINSNIVH